LALHHDQRFLLLAALKLSLMALSIIHAMGHPLICNCGYIKLFHAGLDDPEVSQHFIDRYTFIHVLHGITVYAMMRGITDDQPSIGLGVLISAGVAGLWEVIENTPLVVASYRMTTIIHGYAGDSVINSMGDMLATCLGFLIAAYAPTWLTAMIVAVI
jgi:hypothetical protein